MAKQTSKSTAKPTTKKVAAPAKKAGSPKTNTIVAKRKPAVSAPSGAFDWLGTALQSPLARQALAAALVAGAGAAAAILGKNTTAMKQVKKAGRKAIGARLDGSAPATSAEPDQRPGVAAADPGV